MVLLFVFVGLVGWFGVFVILYYTLVVRSPRINSLELVSNCCFFLHKNINVTRAISTFLANVRLWCSRKLAVTVEGSYNFTSIRSCLTVASYIRNTYREVCETEIKERL